MVQTPVGIDLWINLSSPRCYLTLVALRKALTSSGKGDLFQLMVHPSFTGQVAEAGDRPDELQGEAEALGIRFADELPPATTTEAAAQLVIYAQQQDYESGQTLGPDTLHLRLTEALLRSHLELGLDLTEGEQLIGIGQDLGISAEDTLEALESEAVKAMVTEDYTLALYLGVQEVPLLLFDEQYVVEGLHSQTGYQTILDTVLAQRTTNSEETDNE